MSKLEQREITCISCPMGCLLTVKIDGEQIDVTGNGCKIGLQYGKNEVSNPKRMITTSIKIKESDGTNKMLSVKTSNTVPKGKIEDCLKAIKKANIAGSFVVGDVVIKNIIGLNVDIVATRDIQ